MFKNLSPGALRVHLTFQEAVEAAIVEGFQGVEIDIVEIENILASKSVGEIKNLANEKGVKLGGWGLPFDFQENEETYRKDLQKLARYAQISQELDCSRVFTYVMPFSDQLPFKENFKKHVERLKPVAEILETNKCYLGLEFIGPKTARANRKYEFIYTMDGVLRLCEAIGTDNMGILLDSWHWYTSHGTLSQLRGLRGRQVTYVHVNNAPAGIQVDEQIDNIRCLPSETEVIDLVSFLKALKKIGYEGPVTPEPFSKKLKEMPTAKAIKTVSKSLDHVWKAAGLD